MHHILPVVGKLQPYSAWFLLLWAPIVLFFSGYYLFAPGAFDGPGFVFCYGSIFIFLAILISSKTLRIIRQRKQGEQPRLGWIPAEEVDLTAGLKEIEALSMAAEAKRAGKPRSLSQKISDFFF